MGAPTPGPWRSMPVSEKTWNVGVYDATGDQIALVKVPSARVAMRKDADARLMAAAPELLAALVELVANLLEHDERNREPECPICFAVSAARAAIVKATGAAS